MGGQQTWASLAGGVMIPRICADVVQRHIVEGIATAGSTAR